MSGTDLLVQFFCKPSAFESEIHPSHKSPICTLGISPLQGAKSVSYTHLGEEVDEAYYEAVMGIEINPGMDKSGFKIVFSPQHGTSNIPVRTCLGRLGYDVVPVLAPVSYTHLDVYKRQNQNFVADFLVTEDFQRSSS